MLLLTYFNKQNRVGLILRDTKQNKMLSLASHILLFPSHFTQILLGFKSPCEQSPYSRPSLPLFPGTYFRKILGNSEHTTHTIHACNHGQISFLIVFLHSPVPIFRNLASKNCVGLHNNKKDPYFTDKSYRYRPEKFLLLLNPRVPTIEVQWP